MSVPGYTEIRELGRGGTGRVMLAVRESDGLEVAIKHLAPSLREDPEFAARFRDEARLLGEIDSPHVARLLDHDERPGAAVIVMELVNGVTLRRLLEREGRTGAEAALAVLKGALLGLAEAHRRGVVHRDFKPENVLVTPDGDSKLVDFGVAARSGAQGSLAGTPPYMAPELWDDAPAGPAGDVYAATLVFFECLTGHRPFRAGSAAALAFQHRHAALPLEDVEEPLRPLIRHGLAKDPAARPASAEAFLAELEETAAAEYGDDWEERGRAGLGILTLPLAALLPRGAQPPGTTTGLADGALTPGRRLAVTGGLVLATAAAVASAFVLLREPPGPGDGAALPPATAAPVPTGTPPAIPTLPPRPPRRRPPPPSPPPPSPPRRATPVVALPADRRTAPATPRDARPPPPPPPPCRRATRSAGPAPPRPHHHRAPRDRQGPRHQGPRHQGPRHHRARRTGPHQSPHQSPCRSPQQGAGEGPGDHRRRARPRAGPAAVGLGRGLARRAAAQGRRQTAGRRRRRRPGLQPPRPGRGAGLGARRTADRGAQNPPLPR
ncbi:serine/threonine-protein kinase [Actinomadura luzonensis]|uniref:serine/threonine-protein kinase n=1 Tax=Actinomadura luzonensis TaxID=2805427 RepID=UPI002674F625|nr:serine/threonine-protein kinase [Actinomadura luzonensis]